MTAKRMRFLTALLVALLLGGGAVVVRDAFYAPRTITVYFVSATGIYSGDEVRVSGVKIGTITAIDPVGGQARMTLHVDRGVPIGQSIVMPNWCSGLEPPARCGLRVSLMKSAASPDLSLLTFTAPAEGAEERVHSGYVRRDGELAQVTGGSRVVRRDPAGWVSGIDLAVADELGRTTTGRAEAVSRLILPGSTSLCTNTALRWSIDGRELHGEDQDVWPLHELRTRRALTRQRRPPRDEMAGETVRDEHHRAARLGDRAF